MKKKRLFVLGIPLAFSLMGCMETAQGLDQADNKTATQTKPLVVPWKVESHDKTALPPGSLPTNNIPRTLGKSAAVAVSNQSMTWYSLANAQSYDVAVGWRDDIFIVNNSNDIYKWVWKNGQWMRTDPTGGSWLKMPVLAGVKWARIASSESNVLVAVSTTQNPYVFNGTTWVLLSNGIDAGQTGDVSVDPAGNVFAVVRGSRAGIYKWNGSSNIWERQGPAITADRVATYGTWTGSPIAQVASGSSPSKAMEYLMYNVWNQYPVIPRSYDIGGFDGTGVASPWAQYSPDYRLWVINNDDGWIYYNQLATNCNLSGTDCNHFVAWIKTDGNGGNVAASYRNQSVVRQSPARYVYWSESAEF
ncbi:MAG: hypothetical protein JWO30_2077 [Fibrobacteres bacterium]|nr:hypothetical protein [Fibrobacterota bacterium]